MAITVIVPKQLKRNEWVEPTAEAAIDATLGASIDFSLARDEKIIIRATNAHATDAKTVTIKDGSGPMAIGDLTAFSIAAGKFYEIVIEGGRFKTGHKVYITGSSADIKISARILPL